MKYGLITMVALLLIVILAAGCRISTTAQPQLPVVSPEEYSDSFDAQGGDGQPTDGGAPTAGGALPPLMEAPEDIWSNEEIQQFGEIKYRLDTGDDPLPTQYEIDAMQEYFDYYDMYNEYLLQQSVD